MDAGSTIVNIAVSRDGKWIVSGSDGQVMLWNARSHEKLIDFTGHTRLVDAVDISSDTTKIVTGSEDCTVIVWSLSTGQKLLGPFKHPEWIAAAKFSPDGRLFATATRGRNSVRIYDSRDGRLLVDFPVKVRRHRNRSIAWLSDSKQLFAISHDGIIHNLDVSSGTTLSTWAIHSSNRPGCTVLARNGTFIVASDDTWVSFWDTSTHKQIGPLIHHPADIVTMALSANYDLAIGGGEHLTLWHLPDILPSPYFDDVSLFALNARRE